MMIEDALEFFIFFFISDLEINGKKAIGTFFLKKKILTFFFKGEK